MLFEFDRMKKTHSVGVIEMEKEREEKVEEGGQVMDYYVNNRWECLGKIDAHNSAILSMTAHANILISTGTKSLKIWDL